MKQKKFFLYTVLLIISQQVFSQCDINTFTTTPVTGSCVQDGVINIQVTGATDCSGANSVTATIREAGATADANFTILSATGWGSFNNLAPGDYEIRLTQLGVTTPPQTVAVTSSYTPMDLTSSAAQPSCQTTDQLYTDDGQIDMSVTGGEGPFVYTISGPASHTSGSVTATSHTFTDLAPGTYIATVTDLSVTCTSSVSQSLTVGETARTPLNLWFHNASRDVSDCTPGNESVLWRFQFRHGIISALNEPGNATYTVNGMTYDLEGSNGTRRTGPIPANTFFTINVTDGCNIYTQTFHSGVLNDDFLEAVMVGAIENCEESARIHFGGALGTVNTFSYWSLENTATLYKEVPINSNNWVIEEERTNVHLMRGFFSVTDLTTRYRLVAEDACHSVERILSPEDLVFPNGLNNWEPQERPSVLEGTSSILMGRNAIQAGSSISLPITATVTRTDGQNSMTIAPTQPYDLAGSYTINFPIVHTFTSAFTNQAIIGDLPLGEYEVTVVDACGNSFTDTVNLTTPTTYAPEVTLTKGCLNSNIAYDMNATHANQFSRVRLYENNGGVQGALVAEYPVPGLSGEFLDIPPGDYFLIFLAINFNGTGYTGVHANWNYSAALGGPVVNRIYRTPVTVDPYEQVTFSSTSLFCNNSDPSSGILSITATGVPIGSLTYSIWNATDDPDTDTPLATYTTTDLTETSYVFQGLSEGSYKVRVFTDCGFTEQVVTLAIGSTDFPPPSATPPSVCVNNSASTLSIALPESLFDVTWMDADGNVLGTGNSLDVAPTETTTYMVQYQQAASLGCTTSNTGMQLLTQIVHPLITQPSAEITSCDAGGVSYTVSTTIVGSGPLTATGTGAPGTWTDNLDGTHSWVSDAISTGTNYYIDIEDYQRKGYEFSKKK